ncbi:PqiC family protein [Denitrificimonas caeni]|uniref:PqiC family protein n=1 Tax=Denitrificimonas caeni TaxID=521720 RepID=UPI0003B4FBEC|nr:ABC-type transport auxiliary lipoprotein family protein [Denitrificimonas caeni]
MKQLMRLPLGIAIVGVLAFGSVGCSIAPPATFYQLQQSTTETASRDNNITVLLGPLRVADYLQRENVLQREADGSLSLSQQARWAGSLQDDIGQLLLRQVSAQLGSSRIALYPDRVGIEAQAQVVLSISRLDSGVQQPAVLEAQWRLLDAKGSLRNSRVLRFEEAHNGEVADQVRAQSELLGQLSKQLVTALQDAFPEQAVSPARKPTAAVATKKPATEKVESINIPVVEPVRAQEVYRF